VLQALHQLQRAQRALAAAQAPYAAAAKDVAAVRVRLNAKETALAEIRARRASGDEQPGDAASMSALGMDAEDLRRIVSGLQGKVDAVAPVVQAAQQTVLDAQRDLATAKSRAELDAMVERVRAIEGHFVAQVRALRLAAQARGRGNFGSVFLPSEKLRMLAAGGWI
jgi:chromosome segregation ATPase